MKRVSLIPAISLIVMLLPTIMAWSNEISRCVRSVDGKIVCAPPGGACLINATGKIACSPPYGGIVMTFDGKALCGPGKCMINAYGQAYCSAVQDGSMTFDILGNPICTGDCVQASASACSWP